MLGGLGSNLDNDRAMAAKVVVPSFGICLIYPPRDANRSNTNEYLKLQTDITVHFSDSNSNTDNATYF